MVLLEKIKEIVCLLLPIVFFATLAGAAYLTLPPAVEALRPWYGAVIAPEEVEAALWLNENIARETLISGDLFACEMLVSVSALRCTIGGAWELEDNAGKRYSDNEKIYLSKEAREAAAILKQYGVKYVFTHSRTSYYAYGWKAPENEKFEDERFFKIVYSNKSSRIFAVVQ